MNKIFTTLLAVSIVFTSAIFFTSCDPVDPANPDTDKALGWFGIGGTNGDNLDDIEDDINLENLGSGTLPSSVDLSANFPPIGNQGSYGTCVAWAVGYNHKSFLEAWDDGHRTTFTESQKFSPRYLFWSVPSASKGADCNGTGFEPAYDVLISNGIATMATSPYTGLGDCSSSPSSSENTNANQYKIKSYREVDVNTQKIKEYLAQNRALSFGAKLGDNFMAANSSAVHSSDTYGYSGQHAYHAMTLCGYDDNKHAFRIVNSWGTGWGDNGYLWVDYDFFTGGDFAFCVFAATNIKSNPDGNDDGSVDDENLNSGKDLMAWEFVDVDNGGVNRIAKYNVFNTGDEDILASTKWNILLVYYNAKDANDYGILLYDYYSDEYGNEGNYWTGENGSGILGNNDNLETVYPAITEEVTASGYWYNNVNVSSGESVAYALYHSDPITDRFSWGYSIPTTVSGEYYLVVIADGFDVIEEYDESNNYFYLTDPDGGPLTFENGVMTETPMQPSKSYNKNLNPQIGEDNPFQSAKTPKNLNTYSTKEIQTMLKNRLETGDMQRKAAEFVRTNKNVNKKSNN